MRTLLWIFLVLVQCNLWAASASSDDEARIPAAGGPARAVAASADERPDSPDDYKFATLAEAVEFCWDIVNDNLLWLRELQVYWVTQAKLEPHNSLTSICLREFLKSSETDKQEWAKFSTYLRNVLTHERTLPDPLNQLIQLQRALEKDISRIEELPRDLDSIFYAKSRNTEAKRQSFAHLLDILLPFSSEGYQSYYRGIGYELRSLIDRGGKYISEPYAKEVGEFVEIGNLLGEVVRLPLACDMELGIEGDSTLYEDIKTSTIQVLTPDVYGFFMPIHRLPSDQVEKYRRVYDEAKRVVAAKIARRQKIGGKARKPIAPTPTVPPIEDTRSLQQLLAEFGGVAEAEKSKQGQTSAKVRKQAAREAAAREQAEREAAALEKARAAEMAAAGAAEIAAAIKAATEADRKRLAAVSSLRVALQSEPLPLEKELGGAAESATLPRTHIGSRELNPENQGMLSDLIRRDVPPRHYDWDQLTNLLGNLGFTRKGTNFVGFNDAGKRKQIGLHYLHNKGRDLNPDLVQTMFKQLHGSVGLGRGALGRLAGIAELLGPWSWESDRRG
jgi:hypothetical protein